MFITVLCLVILFLVAWWVTFWQRVKSYWSVRNVPHQPPHPVLGSLTFLQKENPSFWLIKMYKMFPYPYIGMWLFWRPALLINSPELARNILTRDADVFRNRFVSSGKADPIGSQNLFTANSLFVDYTTDVLGEAAFGMCSEAIKTGGSVLREVTKEFMRFDLVRGLHWSSIFFFPELAKIFGCQLFPKRSIEILRTIFTKMVAEKSKNLTSENRDLLDALIKMKKEAEKDDEDYSDNVLLAQAAIFIQGGFETSASTMTFAIYELAYNPEVQERLYKALVAAKNQMKGDDLDGTILSEVEYLNCVIKETLRKYPPLGWLDRISSESYKVDDTLTLPPDSVVYINVAGIQSDPDLFPEPQEFIPERFNSENEVKPFTFLSYGEGPRQCIGIRFGYQTLRFGLASIILNFEIRPIDGNPPPNDCHIESNGFVFAADKPLSVDFVPRY